MRGSLYHHRAAEMWMGRADAAKRDGDDASYRTYSYLAAHQEERALSEIPMERTRTRAIIAASAAALYRRCGKEAQAAALDRQREGEA